MTQKETQEFIQRSVRMGKEHVLNFERLSEDCEHWKGRQCCADSDTPVCDITTCPLS